MRHLSDGALRRLYDEPYALDEETRAHYNECRECQARFTVVADDARHALALMAVPTATVDPVGALARLNAHGNRTRSRFAVLRGRPRRPLVGGLAAAVLAIGLIATMTLTPLAANLVKIFQPSQIQPVPIAQGDLTGLDAFANWGDVKWTKTPELKEAGSAAEASQISGLSVIKLDPGKLPSGLASAPVSYAAVGEATGTVTFNSNAPPKLRGSTLSVVVGPAETAIYGDLKKLGTAAGDASGRAGAERAKQEGGAASGEPTADQAKQALASAGPILAVAKMRAPQVSSTGATVADIKKALLSQPGLSAAVRLAIQSIDDPTGNLPLPIPAGYANAHSVQVQGVPGTAVGDNTGLGAAVIWIKNSRGDDPVVYGLAGTVTEDQLLAVANSVS